MLCKCFAKPAQIFLFPKHCIFAQVRPRHFWKNMDCTALHPPLSVRGMTKLDRDAFRKVIRVPKLKISEQLSNQVLPLLKKLLLTMDHLKPVRQLDLNDGNSAFREVLLHPIPVTGWESLPNDELTKIGVVESDFYFGDLELAYENWRGDEILKSILPDDDEGLTSYSRVGHIVHVNLRDHLQPYKILIGDVLKDKVSGCKTVVNKLNTINNIYRNFPIEVICGVEDFEVQVKENGISFDFDFSKVYWNPRLSTEHERIVKLLQPGDVLYDVFAGVGPFSIPAARKRCIVLANDLNPESYKWLLHNAKKNKCTSNITMYNKDGRDFILNEVKEDLVRRLNDEASVPYKIHMTMNLPAMSVEFLDAFRNLISPADVNFDKSCINYPLVHVYSFSKGENTQELVQRVVEQHLGLPLADNLQSITFVRNVAPNKDMYRVAFYLTKEILTTPKIQTGCPSKRHSETVDEATIPKIPCSS